MRKCYTNADLAEGYFNAASAHARNVATYVRIAELIRIAPQDIPQYHHDHGSLRGLRVPGLGRQTLHVCELVMQSDMQQAHHDLASKVPSPSVVLSGTPSPVKHECSLGDRWTGDAPAWTKVVEGLEKELDKKL
jgi:hypothetical protein